VPALGTRRLNAITTEEVQRLKLRLGTRSAKTTNNVLSVLNMLLKKAVEWGVLDGMPCTVRLLPIAKPIRRIARLCGVSAVGRCHG